METDKRTETRKSDRLPPAPDTYLQAVVDDGMKHARILQYLRQGLHIVAGVAVLLGFSAGIWALDITLPSMMMVKDLPQLYLPSTVPVNPAIEQQYSLRDDRKFDTSGLTAIAYERSAVNEAEKRYIRAQATALNIQWLGQHKVDASATLGIEKLHITVAQFVDVASASAQLKEDLDWIEEMMKQGQLPFEANPYVLNVLERKVYGTLLSPAALSVQSNPGGKYRQFAYSDLKEPALLVGISIALALAFLALGLIVQRRCDRIVELVVDLAKKTRRQTTS